MIIEVRVRGPRSRDGNGKFLDYPASKRVLMRHKPLTILDSNLHHVSRPKTPSPSAGLITVDACLRTNGNETEYIKLTCAFKRLRSMISLINISHSSRSFSTTSATLRDSHDVEPDVSESLRRDSLGFLFSSSAQAVAVNL